MLYDDDLKDVMLGVLENRTSGIANCIEALFSEGYIPNQKKYDILSWSTVLIHAYENVNVLSKEQQYNLDRIYNKVLKL